MAGSSRDSVRVPSGADFMTKRDQGHVGGSKIPDPTEEAAASLPANFRPLGRGRIRLESATNRI
jgi:hypothetical protein